jgi:acetyl/propionyl-CoA carboxylase alpha subunit
MVTIDGGSPLAAGLEQMPDGLLLTIDGRTQRAVVARDGLVVWIWIDGETFSLTELAPERDTAKAGSVENEVRSPMPGTVIIVNVNVGDEVEEGEALLIVEAMKMEYTLVSPRAGRVDRVLAVVGDRVLVDAPLINLEPVRVDS